jgi:lysozyme
MNLSNNIDFAKKAEGTKRLHNGNHAMYECPAGYWTIGYGRNIQNNGISENEAERMLHNDLGNSLRVLEANVSCWSELDSVRKGVLIDMCFNMGWGTFSKFKKMLAALENKDYEEAAKQMQDSAWFRQVGHRAIKLITAMRTGEWQDY